MFQCALQQWTEDYPPLEFDRRKWIRAVDVHDGASGGDISFRHLYAERFSAFGPGFLKDLFQGYPRGDNCLVGYSYPFSGVSGQVLRDQPSFILAGSLYLLGHSFTLKWIISSPDKYFVQGRSTLYIKGCWRSTHPSLTALFAMNA